MDRRHVLRSAGSVLIVGLAGCAGDGEAESSDWKPVVPDDADEFPVFEGDVSGLEPDDVHEEIRFGKWEEVEETFEETRADGRSFAEINIPWAAHVVNEADVPLVEVGIVEVETRSVVHHEAHEIPKDRALRFLFLEPGTHVVQVHVPASGVEHGVRQPPGEMAGNQGSTTRIVVLEEDRIESGNAALL